MKSIEDMSRSAGSVNDVRFGDVDVPGDLVSAHADGRLVLFVGAGASLPAPSSLPTFRELAQRIADDSQYGCCEEKLEKPDELLGEIASGDVDVHLRVHDLIRSADSRPNALHEAIVDLAGSAPVFRVVTTNYDRHMSGFLPAGVDEFEAPALPPGNVFHGLVYLHGSVRQEPSRLVVTKSDFGQAYFDSGWATGFLKELFGDFAILFIGYGLNDTLMQYLVEALSPKADVYALTREPEDPHWAQHGVMPVGYGTHEQLPGLIQQWAGMARMEMLDHDRRIAGLVSGAPPLSAEDESYLEAAVAHPEKISLFTTHARGVEWLRWISSRPQFKALFDPWASLSTTEHCLKSWFVNHHAVNDDFAGEALALVPRNGGLVNRELWFSLVESLSRPDRIRSEAVNRWLPVLAQTMPSGCNDWLGMLLSGCELPRDKDLAMVLLDRVFEPRLAVARFEPGRMEVVVGTEESWIQCVTAGWLESSGPILARDLVPLVDQHLRRFYLLSKTLNPSGLAWRLDGRNRASIESREDEGRDGGVDFLIDAARDVVDVLVVDTPNVTGEYLRAWSEHEWPVLRRLAVHGWAKRTDVTDHEKLLWLVQSDMLLDSLLRPEVMRLLEATLPEASPDTVEAMVEQICGAPQSDERYAYHLLGWIAEHAPESASASGAFAVVQTSHPDWRPLTDPDFPTWTALPAEDLMKPLELQGLHDPIQADAEAAVAGLINGREERAGRGIDWIDALDAVFSTVVEHFEDGVAVLEVLACEPTAAPDLERELGEAVLNGWTYARARLSLTDDQCICVARMLPDVWRLGLHRWGDAMVEFNESGWLSSAKGHWAGMAAGIWIEAALAERRNAGDGWTGLPDAVQAAIQEMTSGDSKASHFAQVVVATQIHLLFQLDEPWCLRNVLPLLDPSSDDRRAIRCWEGYLAQGRADEQLLRAGLRDHFVAMAPLVARLALRHPEARSSYAGLAANICIDGSIDPLEDGWLPRWVATSDIETRVAWVHEMTRRVSRLSADAADAYWSKWMRRYWENRLVSIPVAITPEETSAMAEWPVLLGERYSEAADLVLQSHAGLGIGSRLLRRLADIDLPRNGKSRPDHLIEHPEATAQLLAHLLHNAGTPAEDFRLRHLPEVVARLDKLLDAPRMEPIVNELLRLGFGEFVGWLQSQRETASDPTPATSLT